MGVHAAEISTKFANGDPRMRNEIVCGKIADTSQTDPVRIRGLPVCVWGERPEILHMGCPCSYNKTVRIQGVTYMLIPVCAQFCCANRDSHMQIF
jgi:hypothetical protein